MSSRGALVVAEIAKTPWNTVVQFFVDNWHVMATLALVLALPFAMNELEARDKLVERIEARISELERDHSNDQAEEQTHCLRAARDKVTARINAGQKRESIPLKIIREQLESSCNPEVLQCKLQWTDQGGQVVNSSWQCPRGPYWQAVSSTFPNSWPSLVIVFFVVSVCSIIGYAATTFRAEGRFIWSKAVFSAVIAFGFLLAIRSGNFLAFTSGTSDSQHNVFGLAFIGFIVGLYTEQSHDWLGRTFRKLSKEGAEE